MSHNQFVVQELELGDYVRIGRRRWRWIVLPALLVPLLAAVLSAGQADTYTSTARVLLADSSAQEIIDSGSQNISYLNRAMTNEIALATGDAVTNQVEDTLGYSPSISVSSDAQSDVLIFRATSPSADQAATDANTWAGTYVAAKQSEAEASITVAVDRLRSRLADLRSDRQEIREPLDQLDDRLAATSEDDLAATLQRQRDRLAEDLEPELSVLDSQSDAVAQSIARLELSGEIAGLGTARVLQVANPPVFSNKPPVSRNLFLGLVVGAIVGVGAALLRENLDRTLKNAEDISRITAVPVLGSIPVADKSMSERELALIVSTTSLSPVADAYFKLRSSIQFAVLGHDIQSLLVTSANQSEGKTTTASNLAWSMATIGKRTVLADVDFRRPRQHAMYQVDKEPGLSNYMIEDIALSSVAINIDAAGHELAVLPAGAAPPRPGDFVASEAFGEVLADLEAQSEMVILDAPPVLPVSDSLTLARKTDAVIVVVRAGSTTKDKLANTLTSLEQAGGHILGIVLIGTKADERYGKYGYYEED